MTVRAMVGIRFACIVMYIFYIRALRNVLPINVNESVIVRDNMSPRGEGVANVSAKW